MDFHHHIKPLYCAVLWSNALTEIMFQEAKNQFCLLVSEQKGEGTSDGVLILTSYVIFFSPPMSWVLGLALS